MVWTKWTFNAGSESVSGGSSVTSTQVEGPGDSYSFYPILRSKQERHLELKKIDERFTTWFLPKSSQPNPGEYKLFLNS